MNIKYFTILIFLFVNSKISFSQTTFQRTFKLNGNYLSVNGLIQNDDGSFIVSGHTLASTAFAVKLNSLGSMEWKTIFKNNFSIGLRSINHTNDGGYILSGTTRSDSTLYMDLSLVKLDSSGNILWAKAFGDSLIENGNSAIQTSDGGFMIAGSTQTTNSQKGILVKTDSNGNLEWSKSFYDSTQIFTIFSKVIEIENSRYVICGYSKENIGNLNYEPCILMADSIGNILWSRKFHYPEWGSFADIEQTDDGGFILTGSIDIIQDSLNSREVLLAKMDSAGNNIWNVAYQRFEDDLGSDVELTSNGGYLVTGSLQQSSGNRSFGILKVDSLGAIEFTNKFNSFSNLSSGNFSIPTFDGGYLTTSVSVVSSQYAVNLIKLDAQGLGGCSDSLPIYNPIPLTFTATSPFITGSGVQQNQDSVYPVLYNYSDSIFCLSTGLLMGEDVKHIPFRIYPNPSFDGNFTIYSTTQYIPVAFTVFDISGRVITHQKSIKFGNTDKYSITLTNEPAGLYYVKFWDENNNIFFEKIIKL